MAVRITECLLCADVLQGDAVRSLDSQGGGRFTWEEPGKFSVMGWIRQLVFTFGSESEAHGVPPHHATWAC